MPALQPITLPDEALPLEPQQLDEALKILSGAAGRVDTSTQEYILIRPDPRTGKNRPLRFIDSTLSRILAALKDSYPEQEPAVFLSLAWRLSALVSLIRAGVLEDWVTPAGLGQTAVPDRVIEVAATLPLAGQPEFDPASFLGALRSFQT
jgi:hypothetical protein